MSIHIKGGMLVLFIVFLSILGGCSLFEKNEDVVVAPAQENVEESNQNVFPTEEVKKVQVVKKQVENIQPKQKEVIKQEPEIVSIETHETIEVAPEEPVGVKEITVDIKADVEVDSDCGTMECFEQSFARCEPAESTFSLGPELSYHYKIIGPRNSKCLVTTWYLAHPNPDWINGTMTCEYDNTKDLTTAGSEIVMSWNNGGNIGNCTGELYKLMTSIY